MLEPEPPFAKIDAACHARFDHPLQRAIDRGPADARVARAHHVNQLVGADVALATEAARLAKLAKRGSRRGRSDRTRALRKLSHCLSL